MVKESIIIPPMTQLWLDYRTGVMIQAQTKQSEISQKGYIKYHIRYPRFPVNQKHYKHQLKFSFRLLLVALLPTSYSTQITPFLEK